MKKIICCIHDKKSDTYEGFSTFNNTNEALRAFQATCEQSDTFKKWPEDFQFVHVGVINFQNGEIDEEGKITKKGDITNVLKNHFILAEAKDFVKTENEKPIK